MKTKINVFFNVYILSFTILALAFTGIISYLSIQYDSKIFKLWKEAYIAIFLMFYILTIRKRFLLIKDAIYFLYFIFFSCIFLFYNVLSNNSSVLILYQIKNDILVLLFAWLMYSYLRQYDYSRLISLSSRLVKLIVWLGTLNAVFGVLEELFYEAFLNMINFSGEWGSSTGLMIFIHVGTVRPIGLQMGFVPYATLCLLTFILICENSLYQIAPLKKYILISFLSFSIIYSHYMTAIIGWSVYCSFYIIRKLLSKLGFKIRQREKIIYFLLVIMFLFMFYTTNDYSIYDIVHSYFPDKADSSIYARVVAHLAILDDISSTFISTIFGAGFGLYGAYNVDSEGLSANIGTIATDSTYSYLLGNYGLLVTILFLLTMVSLYHKIHKNDCFGVSKFILYTMVIEFFFNNCISDFPINYILIILTLFSVRLGGEK